MKWDNQTVPELVATETGTGSGSSLIQGSGEMAARIRAHAWEKTCLGAIPDWPLELLAVVNLMLASREIATVFWGPERLMIYNEAYAAQL